MVDTTENAKASPETPDMLKEIGSADARIRRFWLKVALFTLPFAIPFLLFTGTLVYLGESMPLRMVLWHQEADELVLFRYRYGNRDLQYKRLAVNVRQPDVLAIGSSRVLQFREGFLTQNPQAFYNAAAPAWRLEQVDTLLRSVDPSALPDILLLGIDPPWFNPAYEGDTFPEPISDFANLFIVNRSVIQDLWNGVPFDRPNFENAQYLAREEPRSGQLALGLRAIRDGHGFRNDGSEQFGDFLVAGWLWQPQQREQHLQWMRDGEDVYPYGQQLDEGQLQRMRDLLTFAQAHDILVVGFLPSYMPTLWAEMSASPQHAYVLQVTEAMQELFEASGYPFFDYSNGAWVGATDDDFFDGWHASERANLQLYIDMVRQVPALRTYSDPDALQQVVNAASNTWYVFEG